MAVAPASMADRIIVLDDDEEEEGESARPSCSTASSPCSRRAKNVSLLRAEQPAATHISQSPFASAKKDRHVVQAENQRLFAEFVEHCSTVTQDCPEVLTFLQTKHNKASPDFLSSVEFRNTLGRCLTRAQSNHSKKTFVYINELCTVLKQHAIKKRLAATKLEPGPSTSAPLQSTSGSLPKDAANIPTEAEGGGVRTEAEEEQPSTSGLQEDREESKAAQQEEEKKARRATRRQIAYLENLLKVYNDEIRRLQEAELSLDDMGTEDSSYLQEHKLKRKMMKIYYKLCELKGCSKFTGRVIEEKILFSGTRYPEINKKIERFINSEEAHRNPPDYQDILQVVLRSNQRYNLDLSRKHMNQIAKDAFRDTCSRMQDRRHLDLVYNFGSHLTEGYRPAVDPALADPTLLRKLRSNREVALSRLDEVISKYATKQEDTEEQERNKRKEKEGNNSEKEAKQTKDVNGVKEGEKEEEVEEEEEDDDEEDESSDPDIEEEIQASTQQNGADDEDEEAEEDDNEAEQADDGTEEEQGGKMPGSVTAEEEGGQEKGLSPPSDQSEQRISPVSDVSSPRDSPSQSEAALTEDKDKLPNGDVAGTEEPADSSNQALVVLVSTTQVSKAPAGLSPAAANQDSSPPSPAVIPANKEPCDTQITNGRSPSLSTRATRSRKRTREDISPRGSQNKSTVCDSGMEISLDMDVISCSPPKAESTRIHPAKSSESTRADTPIQELVSSSQTTPPPKKNKVNVATQCDPDEIIVLSDSE